MIEKELCIDIDGSPLRISATLTFEDNYETLVIIIPGTGHVDRDGNVKEMKANLYKELSQKLSINGIATLRYDKPGVGKSTGDYYRIGMWDSVDCIKGIITYFTLSEEFKFNRIILLGHSEGTILATLIFGKIHVQGLILLAGAGSSLKSIMLAQSNLLAEEVIKKKGFVGLLLKNMLSKEKVLKKQTLLFNKVCTTNEDFVSVGGQKIQAKWLREHLEIDDTFVLNILTTINCPFLIINGDKDLQIDSRSLPILDALKNSNKTVKTITGMNHMLKLQKEESSILKLKQIYLKMAKLPIANELVEEITKWLHHIEKSEGSK